MKCTKCQTENESGARFCANCGNKMTTPRTAADRARATGKTTCPNCGQENPTGSTFCETCGTKLAATPEPPTRSSQNTPSPAARPQTGTTQTKAQTSGAWWLLPIFLGWVGGLIGYLVVKESDQSKAKGLLIFGIVWTVFWVVVYIIGLIVASSVIDF
jgi:hypothetical protein